MTRDRTERVRFEQVGFGTARSQILDRIDLRLEAGDSLTVIGPNGAGKTTLLRLLVGLLVPTDGARLFHGEPYADLSREQLARGIAYVPQVRPAHVPLTVEQMLLLARFPHFAPGWRRGPRHVDFRAVDDALHRVEISSLRRRPMDELSGGERQLVHIAAALAQETEILVLDEPTSDLDPRHEREVTELLRSLHRERRRTVVTATHDLLFAGRISDRVMALKNGRSVVCDRAEKVLVPDRLEAVFETPFHLFEQDGQLMPVVDLRVDPCVDSRLCVDSRPVATSTESGT